MSNPNVMKGLSADFIAELASKSRSKNVYGPKLLSWINDSDEAGIDVQEVWPIEFGGKKPTALYQGFLNAVKAAELDDTVQVKNFDGKVYLLHKERVALITGVDSDATDAEDDEASELEDAIADTDSE
jgi:hypothetical protein